MVEVRAGRGGPEWVGQVGLADEGGGAVRVGVQGNRLDPRPRLRGQVPDGVDEPHRGLTAVDDRDTTEHRVSLRVPTHQKAMPGAPGLAFTCFYPARYPAVGP